MRQLALALLLAAPAASALAAPPEVKDVGFGVVVGDPTGGTVKLWLDDAYAVDVGVGFSGDAAFWGDLLWHAWNALPQPSTGRLAPYLGIGPRLEAAPETEFGIRTIAGLTWRFTRQPIELFAEAGPVFRMTPSGRVDADGGIGVRIYLGKK